MKVFCKRMGILCVLTYVFVAWGTEAQALYPDRNIEIIVTVPAGGAADLNTRAICKYAEKELGRKINIVNIVGGSNAVGYIQATNSKPDGYTLVGINSELTSLEVQKLAPIGRGKFDYIVGYACQYVPIIASNKAPWKTYQEFINLCKQKPGQYNVGGTPERSLFHLAAVHLMEKTGTQFNWVPFDGAPKIMAAVAGGHIHTAFFWMTTADAYIKSSEMIPLVVMAPNRVKDYPNVPTLKEIGIDLTYLGYYGVGVPKGAPPEVLKILRDAFTKVLNDPLFQEEMVKIQKQELLNMDHKAFTDFLDQEYEKISVPFKILGVK